MRYETKCDPTGEHRDEITVRLQQLRDAINRRFEELAPPSKGEIANELGWTAKLLDAVALCLHPTGWTGLIAEAWNAETRRSLGQR